MVSGEKRNCEEDNVLEKINTILLDIEGTTTSISFVKDVLFPYIRENLKTYVESHWEDQEFKADLKALKDQAKKDEEDKVENFCPIEEGENEKESLIKNVFWQMDLDRKTTALKQLQGHVWREGYENGKLKGHVYPEVAQTLKKWNEDGRKIYIFSSGSVEAQKLLFKNSESGDLLEYLAGHFDTEVGPKTEPSSYTSIAKSIGCDCSQILFLTDVVKEAVAADKAGMQVTIVIREGNVPLTDDDRKAFPTVTIFTDLVFESSIKKIKRSDEEVTDDSNKKTENEEKVEEPEVKNGNEEKMEVDTSEANTETKDCVMEKTEHKEEAETETNNMEVDKNNEAESDNIDIDVDDSKNINNGTDEKSVNNAEEEKTSDNAAEEKTDNSTGDKTVSSSVEDNVKVDETANGTVEKPSEEENKAEKTETPNENKEEAKEEVTSTPDNSKDVKETTEESLADVDKNSTKEEEKTAEEDAKEILNGHENGTVDIDNDKEASGEVNGEATEKTSEQEVSETVAVNKVISEEQADSTIEVTA